MRSARQTEADAKKRDPEAEDFGEEEDDDDEDDEDFKDEGSGSSDDEDEGQRRGGAAAKAAGGSGGGARRSRRGADFAAVDEDEVNALLAEAEEAYGKAILGDDGDDGKGGGNTSAADAMWAQLQAEDAAASSRKTGVLDQLRTKSASSSAAATASTSAGRKRPASEMLASSSGNGSSSGKGGAGSTSTSASTAPQIRDSDDMGDILARLNRNPKKRRTGEASGSNGIHAAAALSAVSGILGSEAATERLGHLVPQQAQQARSSGSSGSSSSSSRADTASATATTADGDGEVDAAYQAKLLEMAESAKAIAAGRKVAIQQTVTYAGEKMVVTKLVSAGTQAAKAAQEAAAAAEARRALAEATRQAEHGAASSSAAAAPAGLSAVSTIGGVPRVMGLDKVMASLDKPESISTLTKTSLDWEQYKVNAGLEEDFESAARAAGFVEKQAFLTRVDARQTEADRLRRVEERRKRELSSGGS